MTSCADCNAGKSSIPLDAPIVADIRKDALRWAAAMKEVAAERAAERQAIHAALDAFEEMWVQHVRNYQGRLPADHGWPETIERFIGQGLTVEDLADFVERTWWQPNVRDRFRYFAGMCWKEIGTRQQLAADLIEIEDDVESFLGRDN